MKSRISIILYMLVVLLVAFCSNDNPSSTAPGPEPDPDPPTNPNLVTREIGPAGGTITSSDDKLTLNIPEGALSGTETISIEAIETDELGSEFDDIEDENAWELGPDGLKFNQPITVAYQVEANEDGNPLEVTMPGLMTESDGDAVALDSLVFEGGTLTGELDHFTPIVVERDFATATVRNVPEELAVGDSVMVDVEVRINSGLFGTSFVNPPSGGEGKIDYFDQVSDEFSAGEFTGEFLTPSLDEGVERFDGSFKYTCVTMGEDDYDAYIGAFLFFDDGTRLQIFEMDIPKDGAKLVNCVEQNTAPVIENIEGRLTSPFRANFTLSGRFNDDLSNLSVLFSSDDGNEDIVIEPENLPDIEDGFKAVIDHLFNEEAAFPINPGFFIENTQTGENDSESFEVDKVTLTVKKNGTGKGFVTATHDTAGFELIHCDPDCPGESAESVNGFFSTSNFELVANATDNSIFTGWSDENGDCKGTDPCFISFNKDYTITATFEQDTSTSSADLSFSFLETDSPVAPGENIPVKVTVSNEGPDDTEEQTSIMLEMSSGKITETPENLECEETPSKEINCDFLDDLVAGSQEELTYTIVIEETGEHIVDGTISFDGEDPDESNNTDETTIIVEEHNTGSDACVQPFGLNEDQALGLRAFTTDMAGFEITFVDAECAGSGTLQLTETESDNPVVDITCDSKTGDCGNNNIINGNAHTCSIETTFGNRSFYFDCFEETDQGDKRVTAQMAIGIKPAQSQIVEGSRYQYGPTISQIGDRPGCEATFSDSDRGVGIDIISADRELAAYVGPYSENNTNLLFKGSYNVDSGYWDAANTLPFGSGTTERIIKGIWTRAPDGAFDFVGSLSVNIYDSEGEIECEYSGSAWMTNRN